MRETIKKAESLMRRAKELLVQQIEKRTTELDELKRHLAMITASESLGKNDLRVRLKGRGSHLSLPENVLRIRVAQFRRWKKPGYKNKIRDAMRQFETSTGKKASRFVEDVR